MEHQTALTDEERIKALRESINLQEPAVLPVTQFDNGEVGIEITEPAEPLPQKPVALDNMINVLKKKKVPFLLIYLTETKDGRHAEFETTIEHPNGADLCHHIIEQNREAFWGEGVLDG